MQSGDLQGVGSKRFLLATLGRAVTIREDVRIIIILCHPTIAGDSTNILLNFTLHDANAIDTYIYTLRRLLSVPIKRVLYFVKSK